VTRSADGKRRLVAPAWESQAQGSGRDPETS
jgi:hypothetical protein